MALSRTPLLKYIGHKASRIRWKPPVDRGDLTKPTFFVTGSYDDKINKVYLWEYYNASSDGDALNEPLEVAQIAVAADVTDLLFVKGEYLIVTLANGTVQLLRIFEKEFCESYEWKYIHCSNSGHPVPCTSATSYSHTSDTVLTGGEDGRILVLSFERLSSTQVIEDKDSTAITSLLSYYHSEVLVANSSGQLKVWDLRSKLATPTRTFSISNEMVSVQCLDHHPNQPHLIAAGCDNGAISFLDLRQEKIPISLVQAHSQEVWESKFHSHFPDNLITCSQDGSLFHWSSSQQYKDRMTSTDIWLSGAVAKGKVDIVRLLPESNKQSVNSFDVESDCLVAVTDGEALYVLPNLDLY